MRTHATRRAGGASPGASMKVSANGIAIEVDDQGPPDGEPLLLVMGLGMQLHRLARRAGRSCWSARGFRVDPLRQPRRRPEPGLRPPGRAATCALAGMRYALRLPVRAPYRDRRHGGRRAGRARRAGHRSARMCAAPRWAA
ncbi:MAG: hypothetical protein MZW92_30570 [Comamonadaceae bacterium]|nr:hypothetical protein [Comamonadaceae bacterium]